MNRNSMIWAVPAVFLALAVVFAVILFDGGGRDEIPSALIGKPAPVTAAEIPRMAGGSLPAADLIAGPALVNFFSSWCVPCKAEHPLLMDLAARDLAPIYGVVFKDKRAAIEGMLNQGGDPYDQVLMDPNSRLALDFGVAGVPETFVIDAQGIIRFKHSGPLTEDIVDTQVVPLLEGRS